MRVEALSRLGVLVAVAHGPCDDNHQPTGVNRKRIVSKMILKHKAFDSIRVDVCTDMFVVRCKTACNCLLIYKKNKHCM